MRLSTSANFVPTRREILLVICLITVLLFITENDYLAAWDGRPTGHDSANAPSKVVEESSQRVVVPEKLFAWKEGQFPETEIVAHAYGWTIFDRLYTFNGTMFVVTSKPDSIPPLKFITSSGYPVLNGDEEIRKRLPSDKDMQIITPSQAQTLFATTHASRIDGASFLVNDPSQFITHYYHFTAELLFGLWRTYSSLDPYITVAGQTNLPPPRRLIFNHVNCSGWRDYAAMNQWVIRGAFPSISFEFSEDWADRASMPIPFVFDRVVLADRAAAENGPFHAKTWRSASEAFTLRGSPHWWAPVRANVLAFSGLAQEWIYGPGLGRKEWERESFVITYISRQAWGRRMLRQGDHDALVKELYWLRDRYGYEVNVVDMDKMTRAEQVQLAGRTTIMMGVHGNGLTSLVWMRPTPRSTVIEFFYQDGFAFDYEYTTRALGMVHYGVWFNQTLTRPNVPLSPNYPEGFQGNDIRVDGPMVAKLVQRRLMLEEDEDTMELL